MPVRRRWCVIGAGFLLLTTACEPTGGEVGEVMNGAVDGAVEIPFRGTAAMILPVYINGEGPLDFALDTGSTLTCVDGGLAERLDLPEARGRQGVTAGASGVGQMSVVRIDSMRVGEASMRTMEACVVNLGHARQVGVDIVGLVGLNFLRAYRVEIDFDSRVVRLDGGG